MGQAYLAPVSISYRHRYVGGGGVFGENGADGCAENELIKCVCVIKLYVKCVDNVAVNVNGNALPRRWRWRPSSVRASSSSSSSRESSSSILSPSHTSQASLAKCDFNDSNKGEHLSEIYYFDVCVCFCYRLRLHLLPRICIQSSLASDPSSPGRRRIIPLWQLPFDEINLMPFHLCKLR